MSPNGMQSAAHRPPGLVAVDGRTYPLEAARLEARAAGGLANTTLTQTYRNPYDEPLEVVYTLPLPADGAVIGYAVRFGERVIRGVVERRADAAETYRRALLDGRVAGLLEQDRDDTFQQRLGSLPPGQAASIEIQVLHPLGFQEASGDRASRWEYRFPTVTAARYQGGEGRVADRERLDADRAADGDLPTRIELDLAIDGDPEALALDSPSHDLAVTRLPGALRARLRHGARLDRDLIVRWNACGDDVGVRVVEGGGLAGDEGRYALLALTPPNAVRSTLPRDLTILIDASGSMAGPPLECAKRVAARLLESLGPSDRFEVITFADRPERLSSRPVEGKPREIERALVRLHRLQAGGATEMREAMIAALAPLRAGAQRQVVLISDGYIGFEREIVSEVLHRLPEASRVHAVGIGSAPNRSLTLNVARAGRGLEVHARDEASAAEAARRLIAAMARPVLTSVRVQGSAVRALAPSRAADVFAGRPLMLAAELDPAGGTLEVTGTPAGSERPWSWRAELPPRASAAAATEAIAVASNESLSDAGELEPSGAGAATPLPLGAFFGRGVIADLELALAARPDDVAVIEARIEAAGLRHRIASRRTSLVAVAEEPSVDPRAPRRRERLAVEMPESVSAEACGLTRLHGAPARFLLSKTLGGGIARRGEQTLYMGALSQLESIDDLKDGRPFERHEDGRPRSVIDVPCTLLRVEGRLLVIEFEAPDDRFVMPMGRCGVYAPGHPSLTAVVVREESSPAGPHAKGRVVRLALRLTDAERWHESTSIVVGEGSIAGQASHSFLVRLRVDLTRSATRSSSA